MGYWVVVKEDGTLFPFTVDTAQCRYGTHWHWGDLVTAAFDDVSMECHVGTIRVNNRDGKETVTGNLWVEDA